MIRKAASSIICIGLVFSLAGLMLPTSVYCAGGEIIVMDQMGLTRLIKESRAAINISVRLDGAKPGDVITLKDIDGLNPDKHSIVKLEKSPSCAFTEVTQGSWQVDAPPGISAISIEVLE